MSLSYDNWLSRTPAEDAVECPCGAQSLHDDERGICSHPSCTEVGCEDCFEKCEGCGKRFCPEHAVTVDEFPFCVDCGARELDDRAAECGIPGPINPDWFKAAVDICGRES